MGYSEIPKVIKSFMEKITLLCGEDHANWAENFNAAFANTVLTTVKKQEDGSTFVLTGDIPAARFNRSSPSVPVFSKR